MANSIRMTDAVKSLPLYERLRRCQLAASILEPVLAGLRLPCSLTGPGRLDAPDADTLVILADSAAQAAKMRQIQPRIVRALRLAGFSAQKVLFRVAAGGLTQPTQDSGVQRHRPLSKEGARAIRLEAARCHDEKIRGALTRLADSVEGR